jgi:hypothetical protein
MLRGDAYPALILASENGQVVVVRELLKHKKGDVNAKDGIGCTTLIDSSARNHVEVVRECVVETFENQCPN